MSAIKYIYVLDIFTSDYNYQIYIFPYIIYKPHHNNNQNKF